MKEWKKDYLRQKASIEYTKEERISDITETKSQ